jgi:hypothetical protein
MTALDRVLAELARMDSVDDLDAVFRAAAQRQSELMTEEEMWALWESRIDALHGSAA